MVRYANATVISVIISFCCVIRLSWCETDQASLARGFNENINWMSLEEGEKLSQAEARPMMLVIHKSWCGACKALKPKFAASKEIEELSRSFVMVNVMDDEEPSDPKFSPDGGYIPRILFRHPDGTVLDKIYNESNGANSKYKYYYSDAASIVPSMQKCLETVKNAAEHANEF